MKILFRGWVEIPHSYAICFCFQLVYLYKNYGPNGKIKKNGIQFFVEEMPYYQQHWYNNKKLVYPKEYNEILKSIPIYQGEEVDLVYSHTYPYNIENTHPNIPKCVFYTSEFAKLTDEYFKCNEENIKEYLMYEVNKNINFACPSLWSSIGMQEYVESNRNKIISHGADTAIFKNNKENRHLIRNKYNIKEDDILMINIGSMTGNKGILLILQTLHILVNKLNDKRYKLLLKGTSDLYQSKQFLEFNLTQLKQANIINDSEIENMNKNIIFTDNTLSYNRINDLFNASDLYISPYLAEGFNLVPLEYLASGGHVLIPETGSTKEYMNDIYNNGGSDFIHYIPSTVVKNNDGLYMNNINLKDIIEKIISIDFHKNTNSELMYNYIKNNYSWDAISIQVYDYFETLLNK